ncbi:NCS2 family nucleobase:cation symporter-2 [Geodermatophilus bullaregiensis]|uniref:uracil-xanthine permease family protein n=1 Tax=Geodermatophilus bullaregiensis TaxID=1564160 RepID=UPI00195B0010|nr:solute carrier family 23 protein [Geodermatophilus bullaregiensis]MBM7806676.1 NCS2 family nucleobase:cation symporter-2 [Geodermatophilus bullaregiensis]
MALSTRSRTTSPARTSSPARTDPADPDGRPPWGVAVPLGLQHVLAMFTSNLTPAVLLAGVIGATTGEATLLVQAALLCAGLATLLQTVGIGPVGSRLPLMMGSGFAFIAVAVPLAGEHGLSAVLGGVLVTAAVQVAIALGIHRVAGLFPPVVTGTIILVIGLGLLPSGVALAAGGVGSPDFGSPVNLGVAALVLVLTVVLNQFCRGLLCTASVLIAVVVGYLVSIPLGLLDLSGVGDRPLVALPAPFEFGVSFPLVAVLSMAVVGVVNTVDSVGTVHAVTEGGAGRPATRRELRGGILAEGGSAVLGGVFGALPTTMFSQNIGLVALTKQMSRHVVTIGALVLVGLSLLPQVAAVLAAIPPAVLGGGVLVLFGMVCAIGVQMLSKDGLDTRALLVVALSVALGRGIASAPDAVDRVTGQWGALFDSGIVVAAVAAVVLNLVLPGRTRQEPVTAEVSAAR